MFQAAKAVRLNAYAPYSNYKVGAAVRSGNQVYAGCNVENVSYGATICAERNAVAQMVAAGHKNIDEILIVTADASGPCGVCVQVLLELAAEPEKVLVHLANEQSVQCVYTLDKLFPVRFASNLVVKGQEPKQ